MIDIQVLQLEAGAVKLRIVDNKVEMVVFDNNNGLFTIKLSDCDCLNLSSELLEIRNTLKWGY